MSHVEAVVAPAGPETRIHDVIGHLRSDLRASDIIGGASASGRTPGDAVLSGTTVAGSTRIASRCIQHFYYLIIFL